jgi:NAD+ synthase
MTMAKQRRIMEALHTKAALDPAQEVAFRVQCLKDYLISSGRNGFVLSISGGQDSALAGRFCQLAVEDLRTQTGQDYLFIALRLPYYNKGNQKAQERMTVHYRFANQFHLLVVGTDHAAEAVVGFFTKNGDGGVDLTPLSGLTKQQGRLLLRFLGADERIYTKLPTADLLDQHPGQLDEDELTISYQVIDDYLEGKDVADEVAQQIEQLYSATEHKRHLPVTPFDTWWKTEGGGTS